MKLYNLFFFGAEEMVDLNTIDVKMIQSWKFSQSWESGFIFVILLFMLFKICDLYSNFEDNELIFDDKFF